MTNEQIPTCKRCLSQLYSGETAVYLPGPGLLCIDCMYEWLKELPPGLTARLFSGHLVYLSYPQ